MKKFLFLLIATTVLISCNKKDANGEIDPEHPELLDKPIPFFDFNSVIYYHLDITKKELETIVKKKRIERTDDNRLLVDMLYGREFPESLNDTTYISNLEKVYPIKINVPDKNNERIRNIFSEKYKGNFSVTACGQEFRDIILFSKNGKITGIARICFGCGQSRILGTTQNTDGFTRGDDWNTLQKLLKEMLPKNSRLIYE